MNMIIIIIIIIHKKYKQIQYSIYTPHIHTYIYTHINKYIYVYTYKPIKFILILPLITFQNKNTLTIKYYTIQIPFF